MEPRPWYFQAQDAGDARVQRRDFVDYLRTHGDCDDDYEAAELIYGEMVGNVVRHAPGPIKVAVEWPQGFATLHVSDTGAAIVRWPFEAPPDPFAESGRGLFIIDKLARRLTITKHPGDGKTVSAALHVHCRTGSGHADDLALGRGEKDPVDV